MVGARTRDRSAVVVVAVAVAAVAAVVVVVIVAVGTFAVGTAGTGAGAHSHAEDCTEVSIGVVEQVVVHQRKEIVVVCSVGDVVQEEVEVDCVGVHVDFLIVVMVVHR